MTKQDYFEQLLDCLPAVTLEEQAQIYEYYNELICDGIEEGNTEADMLLRFGDPAVLAARLQEEWELSELPVSAEALSPTDSAFHDPSHVTYDGEVCCYTSERHLTLTELFISECNLSVIPSPDPALHIYFPKDPERFTRISEHDGNLHVQCKPKKQNPFSFFFPYKPEEIRPEIPLKAALTLHAVSRNGSISIQNLALDETVLETANASLKARSLVTKHLELVTKNAPISLEDVIYTDAFLKSANSPLTLSSVNGASLHGETSNSKIIVTRTTASDLRLSTTNGKISVEDSVAASVSLQTSNGKINVGALKSKDISLTTSNGAIRGNILGNEKDYSISCHTSNGRCTPQTITRPDAPGKLTAHSSNASIQLAFLS